MTNLSPQPLFRCRRIGHVNLYISDYERSLAFYRDIVGLHDGWTRPKIGGAFLNNGASHHDIGFLPWHSAERRVAVDGPGLNHLAFDVGTEARIVTGFRSAVEEGYEFLAAADHIVSKSLYCLTPDRVQLELYADTPISFRDSDFLAMRRATSKWDPATLESASDVQYAADAREPTIGPDTLFHVRKLEGATLAVRDLEESAAFFQHLLGLSVFVPVDGAPCLLLQGHGGQRDLVLWQESSERPAGLHHFSFSAFSEADLENSLQDGRAAGVEIVQTLDHPLQRAVILRDPDGLLVKIFVDRADDFSKQLASCSTEELIWLV